MLILHLSDLHFSEQHNASFYDLARQYRNELYNDCYKLLKQVGSLDLVLITGDVAKAGKSEEYRVILSWFKDHLARLIHKPLSDALKVVPGNHDIDRAVISSSPTLHEIQNSLRLCPLDNLDERLSTFLTQDSTAQELLYRPLHSYNKFAGLFGCSISAKQPYWENDYPLTTGYTIRIRGMNSTLVSDSKIDNDTSGRLVLGRHQTIMTREPGIIYLTACHHPPEWLRDGGMMKRILNKYASIQLFGHLHEAAFEANYLRSLRVHAGAVQPKIQPGYVPTYELLKVNPLPERGNLQVLLYIRMWDELQQSFIAYPDEDGNMYHTFDLELSTIEVTGALSTPAELHDRTGRHFQPLDADHIIVSGNSQDPHNSPWDPEELEQWFLRFASLPYLTRVQIARRYGVDTGNKKIFGSERLLFQAIENAARKRNAISDLQKEISRKP